MRIGHYRIIRKLGEGGMGLVYAAHDERLERTVALKMLSLAGDNPAARQRLWREARAAASINHPNICHIHEIGEDDGTLFIAMELLEGETLAERLQRGALAVSEAVPIAVAILDALGALHERGLVHRDLKPSNVFLTAHGVKLLDFGLARPEHDAPSGSAVGLTRTGVLIGTPRYMSPEQALGQPVDARADLFAAGALLFEMLAGRAAFGGESVVDVLHATVHEQPPALTGSPAIAAVDRVIRRALAKRPSDRFPSAEAMADELHGLPDADDDVPGLAQPLTRIVVLPFRVLRPDPETDFLAFSLPDAIATSLSEVRSLVVRSTATAVRFAGDTPDLKQLAAEVAVDRVVIGTLLRASDQVRSTVQLVEAPGGTLLASHTIQSPIGDLFGLQDDIARRVVDALSLPLAAGVPSPAPEAPQNPRAYEFYLRANELARSYDRLPQARELYVRALELDPRFAAAWAHLARCHRVIGKFVEGTPDSDQRAQDALERALALAPRLSVAHKLYASLEADMGRAEQGLVRLLREAARHGNDPELFAGLVQTCRYCGLYDEAIAAHAEARRLDPKVPTSLDQTLLTAANFERLLAVDRPAVDGGGDEGIRIMALGLSGRYDEARRALTPMRNTMRLQAFQVWADYLAAWIDHRPDVMQERIGRLSPLNIREDPEALFLQGWMLCDAGAHQAGLEHLQRSVSKGYYAAPTLGRARQFEVLRSTPAFQELEAAANAGRQHALSSFLEAGGARLLGRALATSAG